MRMVELRLAALVARVCGGREKSKEIDGTLEDDKGRSKNGSCPFGDR